MRILKRKGLNFFAVFSFLKAVQAKKNYRTLLILMLALVLIGCESPNPSTAPSVMAQDSSELLDNFETFIMDVEENLGKLKKSDISELDKTYNAYLNLLNEDELTHQELLRKTELRLSYMFYRSQIEFVIHSDKWFDKFPLGFVEKKSNHIIFHPQNTNSHEEN